MIINILKRMQFLAKQGDVIYHIICVVIKCFISELFLHTCIILVNSLYLNVYDWTILYITFEKASLRTKLTLYYYILSLGDQSIAHVQHDHYTL